MANKPVNTKNMRKYLGLPLQDKHSNENATMYPSGRRDATSSSIPQAELREAIWQAIKGWDLERNPGDGYAGATGTDVQTILDAIEPVFQAREQHCDAISDDQPNDVHIPFFNQGFRAGQQQLLTGLLGEAVAVAMTPDSNTYVPAVPVSVIEAKLARAQDGVQVRGQDELAQNKTNDGGSDGGL